MGLSFGNRRKPCKLIKSNQVVRTILSPRWLDSSPPNNKSRQIDLETIKCLVLLVLVACSIVLFGLIYCLLMVSVDCCIVLLAKYGVQSVDAGAILSSIEITCLWGQSCSGVITDHLFTHQLDARWFVEWREQNYTQFTIGLTVAE
jgi:hypothetical protein